MVGNVVRNIVPIKFDLRKPTTSFSVLPVGTAIKAGDTVAPIIWTNKDVTLTFLASDPGAADVPPTGSGVDYTEYFVGDTSMSGPGTPTKGSSVTITTTSPKAGPVVVWFRSVDKAAPANVEVWQKLFVYIDKLPPTLENDVPTWWITGSTAPSESGPHNGSLAPFDFWIWMNGTDINSGIGPKLLEWRMPNWKHNPAFALWHQIAPNNPPDYGVMFSAGANAVDDGIYSLDMRASDRASNEATMSTPVQIDTRPPVTDGASGWINGLEPYILTGTDQSVGAGVAATIYRVDQSTPWLINEATPTVGTTLETMITLKGEQGSVHTIDFGSVDAALPYYYSATKLLADGKLKWPGPSYTYGNLEGVSWVWMTGIDSQKGGYSVYTGYKTRSVKLDVTAPVVTAMDPKNGNWQKGPGVVNFSGTDVGAGYAYTEWSTDGGTTWTKGEVAAVGGDGEITVTYHGVDKVGIKSADQTIVVKVASTPPTVTAKNASVKKGHKATFKFTVTAVTPMASRVVIQIRTKSGRTLSSHSYANVTTNAQAMRSFRVNLPKGKYNIRIGAVDQAGNEQTRRGSATLTVK